MRLSKGVHVVVDGGEDWGAALTIPHDKVRVSFAVPWEGMLLLGTTDTQHDGEPETARVTDDDVRTILAEAAVAVDGIGPPRATFCGLRVLPGGDGRDRERAPRDGLLDRADRDGQRRRRQADDVPPDRARRARPARRARTLDRRPRPLPGADGPRPHRLAGRARRGDAHAPAPPLRLARARGARARRRRSRRCSSRSSPAAPTCARRSSTRATHEWARTDEDVLRRRTTAWLAGEPVSDTGVGRGAAPSLEQVSDAT